MITNTFSNYSRFVKTHTGLNPDPLHEKIITFLMKKAEEARKVTELVR